MLTELTSGMICASSVRRSESAHSPTSQLRSTRMRSRRQKLKVKSSFHLTFAFSFGLVTFGTEPIILALIDAHEPDPVTRLQKKRRGAARLEQAQRRPADQPPAART